MAIATLAALMLTLPPVAVHAGTADTPVTVAYTVETADGPQVRTEHAPTPEAARTRIAELSARADVTAAEIDVPMRPLATDTHRAQQWGLTRLSADEVWASADACGQIIAVVDSGVDGNHPDLQGVLLRGVDLVRTGTDGRYDPSGHGTHVAGIAAAATGNGRGIAGLAIGARLLPISVEDAHGFMSAGRVAQGVLWAVDNGASVINLSLGGDVEARVLEVALAEAVRRGVVVVAAAGNANKSGNPRIWPGASPHTIAVAAVNADDTHADFSSTGDWVDLAAPGEAILSTTLTGLGHYRYESGTSMAVPLVSATAAILQARDPSLTPAEIRRLLVDTAEDLGAPGWDEEFGHGLVDPVAALARVGKERRGCFDDIAGRVHEPAIESIVYAGITAGCSTSSFCPGASVTRGQMATFLVRALGLPSTRGGDYFTDDERTSHEDSINRVALAQIATGCDSRGRYCPHQAVNRAQMASLLSRALRLPPTEIDYFVDDAGSVHEPHVNALAEAGITGGCDRNEPKRFCPDETVTRAQTASFLQRLLFSADLDD